MAAQYALDRGMAFDQFRQTIDPAEAAQLVHEADADLIRRVVHQQDGRPSGRLGQPVGQPIQPPVAQHPGDFSRRLGIQRNDPYRQVVDRVLEEGAVSREPGLSAAEFPQAGTVVMVAGDGAPR
jgi:hypothetical protein